MHAATPLAHVYALSTVTYLVNLAILLVVLAVGYLALRWLRTKARESRLRAWERDGLLLPEDQGRSTDPDLAPEARYRQDDERR